MLLDRIVIDAHGPLRRVELGPFTTHLNAVFTPEGSGKTAIARFLCDSLISREYPLGMFSSSSGRVVWADRNGLVHCRREMDGTASGRRSVEFESRGDTNHRFEVLDSSWVPSAGHSAPTSVFAHSVELPESIVDGVITDVTVSNVARIVAACTQNGLDSLEHDARPRTDGQPQSRDARQQQLADELRQVENELASLGNLYPDHETLLARKNQLLGRLARPQGGKVTDGSRYADLRHQLTQLHDRARRLRARQNELRRWIANINGKRREQESSHPAQRSALPERRSATLDDYVRQARGSRHAGEYIAELGHVTSELDWCLSRAAELRRSMRTLPMSNTPCSESDGRYAWIDREAMVAELRRIDDCPKQTSRAQWLQSRRSQLLEQMHNVRRATEGGTPLARVASGWLSRLTAGRLQRVHWQPSGGCDASGYFIDHDEYQPTRVRIDDRDAAQCSVADRALAAMSVRLAAGELLASSGRHLPLVLETQGEMFRYGGSDAIAAAIADYAQAGRQVVVLTSDQALSSRLIALGGRGFQIHQTPIAHPHRPLWKPHFQSETYVGPHPHIYGADDEPRSVVGHLVDENSTAGPQRVATSSRSDAEINRDLDVAWREDQRYDSGPAAVERRPRDPRPLRAEAAWRDGYFFSNSFSTHESERRGASSDQGSQQVAKRSPASPFLLSVDSPIDQAPSIDAVAAARLRGLDVTHIQHLMRHDANRLADALGMASVEAKTIRRWKAECRLVCRVPNLRGFDARILIGSGVKTPAQLAAIHPSQLLKKVEAFLATKRGQQVLLSGSSHELSRITSWIAAANTMPATAQGDRESLTSATSAAEGDRSLRRRRIIQTMNHPDVASNRSRGASLHRGTGNGHAAVSSRRSSAKERPTSGAARRRRRRSSVGNEGAGLVRYQAEVSRRGAEPRGDTASGRDRGGKRSSGKTTLTFNLHRDDDVVDAPAIGPRMAERLKAIEVFTVGDLLSADPETLAAELDHQRIDADTVESWQQQATLVCRVPMLRGHDAQLLVAAEVTTPEALAECDAEELLELVDEVAQSKAGRRIIRGGDPPDLAEVTNWIEYAQHQRELKVA